MRLIAPFIFFLVIAGLVGCQTAPQGPSKNELYSNYRSKLDAAWSAGRISFVERTNRLTDYGYQLFGRDSDNTEFFSYSRSLAPKIDAKTMTRAEYDYLTTAKGNEIRARRDAAEARERSLQLQEQAVRNSNKPVECRTIFGTTRCERSD